MLNNMLQQLSQRIDVISQVCWLASRWLPHCSHQVHVCRGFIIFQDISLHLSLLGCNVFLEMLLHIWFSVETWILLPTLPTSREECFFLSFFFTGSEMIWNIFIQENQITFHYKYGAQKYLCPLQSKCIWIADKCCVLSAQLSGDY